MNYLFELNERLLQQEAVAKLGIFSLSHNSSQLMQKACEVVAQVLMLSHTKILELNENNDLVMKGGVGWKKNIVVGTTVIKNGRNSQAGYSLLIKRPVVVVSLENETRFRDKLLSDHGIKSGISCDIYLGKTIYGVLSVHSTVERNFSKYDLTFLQSVANIISQSILKSHVEDSLKESELSFRRLAESMPQFVWIADENGNSFYKNRKIAEFYGSEEKLRKSAVSLIHPDDLDYTMHIWSEAKNKKINYQIEHRLRMKDGSYRWFLTRALPQKVGGKVLWYGTTTDIHEMKVNEFEMLRQSALNQIITTNASSALFMINEQQRCILMNPAAEELTGYALSDLADKPLHDYIHHHHADGTVYKRSLCPINKAFQEKERTRGEEMLINKDGHFIPIAFTASPIINNGVCVGSIIEARDITNERIIQEALRQNEAYFRNLADCIPQLVWIADISGVNIYTNKQYQDYTGLSDIELRTDKWKYVIHPDDRSRVINYWNSRNPQKEYEIEYRIKKNNGEYRWFLSRAFPMRDEKNTIYQWLGTSTDIHEQKTLAQQKDEFLAIASHELKTPVTSIKAFAQVLEEVFTRKDDSTSVRFIHKMHTQIDKLNSLISDLLDVSNIQDGRVKMQFQPLKLSGLVGEVVEEMQLTTQRHTIHYSPHSDASIEGDVQRLTQVFTNLISNAIKYSPREKNIDVTVYKNNHYLITTVRDYGIGIPLERQKDIFKRFYRIHGSDRDTYAGLGLGLFIAHQIVIRHKGTLTVESHDNGTQFICKLPLKQYS